MSTLVQDLESVESDDGAVMELSSPVEPPQAQAEWHLRQRLYALSVVSRLSMTSESETAPLDLVTSTPHTPILTPPSLTGLEVESLALSYLLVSNEFASPLS
jgi:hypothetical protein